MQPAIINIFEKAAKKAGRIIIRDFGEIENLQINSKSIGDFVTNTDVQVEKNLIETIKQNCRKLIRDKTGKKPFTNINIARI